MERIDSTVEPEWMAGHLITEFEKHELGRLRREELQQFLDRKAAGGSSYTVVAHLRWDLRRM